MPVQYLRRLTGRDRSESADRELALYLAFIAGAVNAGGFLAVRRYTSHMSGIVSGVADSLALGNVRSVYVGVLAVLSFLLGAICTSVLVRYATLRKLNSRYACPLVLEAGLLIIFGVKDYIFAGHVVTGTVTLLCFTMGLQNAIITNISGTVIRTTHLTGIITDVGIKLGRMAYTMASGSPIMSQIEKSKLVLLLSMTGLFFAGGVAGALGFRYAGFLFTLPLAAVLLMLAAVPIFDDLSRPWV